MPIQAEEKLKFSTASEARSWCMKTLSESDRIITVPGQVATLSFIDTGQSLSVTLELDPPRQEGTSTFALCATAVALLESLKLGFGEEEVLYAEPN